jgi:hypothetical protein
MSSTEFLKQPIAKLSALEVGASLVADNGFDCIRAWSRVDVQKDERGELYVACKCGQHFLEGQLDHDDQDTIVGLRIAST